MKQQLSDKRVCIWNLPAKSNQVRHPFTGLQIFFQDWWAEVTHGAKNGGSFSEMMGLSISN